MNNRKVHKIIGLVLVLPMLGWVITGLIFFIKPGYQGAYEQLAFKTYPLEQSFSVPADSNWQEAKLVKTILGRHLLVKSNGKVEHLDPDTLLPKEYPVKAQYKTLLDDAILSNQSRYGDVINIDDNVALTSTGIEIKLNWNSFRLSQQGQDTKLINLLYQIHYLQWSPFKGLNQILGILGLLLLITLTGFGIKIYLSGRVRKSKR